jgi:Tol biopolymer transport system component
MISPSRAARALSTRGATALLFALAMTTSGCSSTADAKGGAGNGTLYVTGNINSNVWTFDLGTGATTQLVHGRDPYFTREGTILCVNTDTQDLGEYAPDGTTFRVIVKNNHDAPYAVTYDDKFQNPQLSPDGRYVAYEGQFGYKFDIYVVDRQTGALLASQNSPTVGIGFERPTWTQDGRLVANGHTNQGLFVSDATWTTFSRFDQNLASPLHPAVSPDGRTVAFVLNDQLYTVSLDGSGLTPIKTPTKADWPTWSPDGKVLAFYSDISILLVPAAGGDTTDLRSLSADADQWMTFTSTVGGDMFWR